MFMPPDPQPEPPRDPGFEPLQPWRGNDLDNGSPNIQTASGGMGPGSGVSGGGTGNNSDRRLTAVTSLSGNFGRKLEHGNSR